MSRSRWWLLAVPMVVFGLVTPSPADAHHKPGHHRGPTTTSPTTTTLGGVVPTTFPGPTVTTAPWTGACSGPITISAGGQLTGGCYESTAVGTPAITIATTAPVVLDHVLVRHRGFGVFAQSTINTNVQVTNSTFIGTQDTTVVEQRAVYLLEPASFIFERNLLRDGQGVLINGNAVIKSGAFRIRYNDYVDIGRWDAPTLVGAVHFDQVKVSNGADVAWNRITNHRGRSVVEDCIGIHESHGGGTNPTRIEIHHNLINGCYPYSGDGASFTGGGIDLGDGDTTGGTWQYSHDNTMVRTTNNGIMVPAGTDLEHANNRIVNSGVADDGARVTSTFGNALNLWDNPGYAVTPARCTMHDNAGDHRRWTGSAWERSWQNTPACDPAGGCTNNTNLGLTLSDDAAWLAEVNDAIADWETARAAAGVQVGPL